MVLCYCIDKFIFRTRRMSEVAQSCPTLCDPYTVACQAPPSMGFSSQEYWGGLPFPSPGDLPYSGIKLTSPSLQADSLLSEPPDWGNVCIYLLHMAAPGSLAVHGLPLTVESGGYSLLWCVGFSLWWHFLLQSTGFRL